MTFYNIKNKISEIFFHEEPDWYWGLFQILFFVIIIGYTFNKNLSIIDYHLYFPLPLFDFFHIPAPLSVKVLIEQFLKTDVSLSFLFLFLKTILVVSLILCITGIFQKFFIAFSLVSFFLFQGWLYGYIRTADNPYVYHCANIACFVFLVCLFSPACNRWTVLFWIKKIKWRNKVKNKDNIKIITPPGPDCLLF